MTHMAHGAEPDPDITGDYIHIPKYYSSTHPGNQGGMLGTRGADPDV